MLYLYSCSNEVSIHYNFLSILLFIFYVKESISIKNTSTRQNLKNTRDVRWSFLIARNFDLDYSRRKECRPKVDALISSLHLSFVRGTFIAHHTHHAYSYGCARRLNYGLSSRARTTEELTDRSHGTRLRSRRSAFFRYLFFLLIFIYSFPSRERYTFRAAP